MLFPVLKRTHTDVDGRSKLTLREFCAFAHGFDINGIDCCAATFELPVTDSLGLSQTFLQIFKEFRVHIRVPSPATAIPQSVRLSDSPASPLAYFSQCRVEMGGKGFSERNISACWRFAICSYAVTW